MCHAKYMVTVEILEITSTNNKSPTMSPHTFYLETLIVHILVYFLLGLKKKNIYRETERGSSAVDNLPFLRLKQPLQLPLGCLPSQDTL